MNYIPTAEFNNSFLAPLTELPDKPSGLYIKGNLEGFETLKFITVVGSRNCSPYSKQIITSLITQLSNYPICIVSGLAFGIDYVAHTTALANNMKTIAFPGSGLDPRVIYPASHKKLADTIVDKSGLLLSEYEPSTKAARWTFPKRNRLMAGIADLVLIVEASTKSGTLITARLATEYNKTVAVIPHNIDNVHAEGSNRLMQDGAYPIIDYMDILDLLNIPFTQKAKKSYSDLSQDEVLILQLLSEPKSRDDLHTLSKLTHHTFIQSLSTLELKGHVLEQYGKVQKV